MVTNSDFNRAEPLDIAMNRIVEAFGKMQRGVIPVVTGFIGKDREGAITTLGRGGSDLTASTIGAALGVREIQVWKDVDGILTSDPRLIPSAMPVPSISFQEAAELAYFGAKVLHPTSILPAMKANIPVRVKNSYAPRQPGTLIESSNPTQARCVAITSKQGALLVHICSTRMVGQYGFLAKVFQIFADLKISIDVIATSEASISMTLENNHQIEELENRLQQYAKVTIEREIATISIIGMTFHSSAILERSLSCLSEQGIVARMVSHGASNVNTTIVVKDHQVARSVALLHEHFFEGEGR